MQFNSKVIIEIIAVTQNVRWNYVNSLLLTIYC